MNINTWLKDNPVNCTYGAPMGSRNYYDSGIDYEDKPMTLRVNKVELDSQGYDNSGRYWGYGDNLYCLFNTADDVCDYFAVRVWFRAKDRKEAIKLAEEYFEIISDKNGTINVTLK